MHVSLPSGLMGCASACVEISSLAYINPVVTKASRRATENMAHYAEQDLEAMKKYRSKIISAANNCNVEPSVVAGIISRESRAGTAGGLINGWGDHGNAWGLMQVDKNWHTPQGAWDSQTHIEQGIGILKSFYPHFKAKGWSDKQTLKGALAAYNMGTQRMDYNNVDAHTTGGDYSADVLARAEFFERKGY